MAATVGLYQYKPLQADEDIRLLTFNPATSVDDEVHCSLRHVRFADLPDRDPPSGEVHRFRPDPSKTSFKVKSYNALSYAWGPVYGDGSHLSKEITCDGKILRVTANLHKALQHYRNNSRRLPHVVKAGRALDCQQLEDAPVSTLIGLGGLWVDAICINQRDDGERGQQVQIMGLIYELSECTVIWLDELDDQISQELAEASRNPTSYFESAHQVTSRSWFQRRWVIQEYFLSTTKLFLLGNVCIRTDAFATVVEPSDPPTDGPFLLQLRRPWVSSAGMSHQKPPFKPHTLLYNMTSFYISQNADAHDCVYALRAISSDGALIQVDYSKRLQQLAREIAGLYVRQKATFAQLLIFAVTMSRSRPASWPSWLPNWARSHPEPPYYNQAAAFGAYATLSDMYGESSLSVRPEIYGDVLRFPAFLQRRDEAGRLPTGLGLPVTSLYPGGAFCLIRGVNVAFRLRPVAQYGAVSSDAQDFRLDWGCHILPSAKSAAIWREVTQTLREEIVVLR